MLCCSKAIEEESRSAMYYHHRGYCFKNLGQFNQAVEDYTVALRLDPGYLVALDDRG
jgi:tetratricopeptide (TPR) repeat protein